MSERGRLIVVDKSKVLEVELRDKDGNIKEVYRREP